MIRTIICREEGHVGELVDLSELPALLADEGNVLWLDLERPTPDELALVAAELRLHPLAVEDAAHRRQRPKIDSYGDSSFLVFYDIGYAEEGHRIEERELAVFLGPNYLATVHDEPIVQIAEVAERYDRDADLMERGVGVLLYALLDTIVDRYSGVADRIGERIGELEAVILAEPDRERLEEIFALRKELAGLRRAVAPERDVAAALARRDLPVMGEATAPYFRDLYDHVIRATDQIDAYRELLGGVLDAYLALGSSRQAEASNDLNQTVRTLTSCSIILMSVTLIAGVYGMNFDPDASRWNMPELNAELGYPGALLAMALVGAALAAVFKRKGWL